MKSNFLFFAMTVGLLSSCCEKNPPKGAAEKSTVVAYRQLVIALGDEKLSKEERAVAYEMLLKGNEEVIPVLVESLKDARVCGLDYFVPNRPSAPMDAVKELTVGEVVGYILSSLVNPELREIHINSWQQFLEENKGKKLSEIRQMIREKYPPRSHK